MDCKRVREAVFLFADNEMDEDLLELFREHLSNCLPCAQRVDYTQKLLAVVRQRCVRTSAPQRLRLRILSRFPHRQAYGGGD